jgi:RimJ/RimL family protein N-acetyltransferase
MMNAMILYPDFWRKRTAVQPTLTTDRLILRPYTTADAPCVAALMADPDISQNTLHIPYPYETSMAEAWIDTHAGQYATRTGVTFAITLKEDDTLIGAMGLGIDRDNDNAELGYWIGKEYWNRGYASEAAAAVVQFGFEVLKLHRIYARYFTRNPASGRVMAKVGMHFEGTLRGHILKSGMFEDIGIYGLLHDDEAAHKDS